MGQIPGVASGLTNASVYRRQIACIPSANQCLAPSVNQDTGGFNISVSKAGMIQLHGNLKGNSGGIINTENLCQQLNPKPLRLLLLIASVFPVCCKFGGDSAALSICRNGIPQSLLYMIPHPAVFFQRKREIAGRIFPPRLCQMRNASGAILPGKIKGSEM